MSYPFEMLRAAKTHNISFMDEIVSKGPKRILAGGPCRDQHVGVAAWESIISASAICKTPAMGRHFALVSMSRASRASVSLGMIVGSSDRV